MRLSKCFKIFRPTFVRGLIILILSTWPLLPGIPALAGSRGSQPSLREWIAGKQWHMLESFLADSNRVLTEKEIIEVFSALRQEGQSDLALRWIESHYRTARESQRLARLYGEYLIELDRSSQAIPVYQDLARRHPDRREYWKRLGQIALWNEQQNVAIQAYEQAVRLDSSDVETFEQLRKLYLWNEKLAEAYALEQAWIARGQAPPDLYREAALHARWLNRPRESIPYLATYLRYRPQDETAWIMLGEGYLWTGQAPQAEKVFRHVVRRWPTSRRAWLYLAQCLRQQQFGWWEAQSIYRRLQAVEPNNKEVLQELSILRASYGPAFQAQNEYIRDSNQLIRNRSWVWHQRYVSARAQVQVGALYHRLAETKLGQRIETWGQGLHLGMRYSLAPRVDVTGRAGMVSFHGGPGFAEFSLRVETTWRPGLFTAATYRYGYIDDGVLGVTGRITAHRFGQEITAAGSRGSLFASLHFSDYSDGNQKWQVYARAEWLLGRVVGRWYAYGLYSYETMKHIFVDAYPYWTPHGFWSRSAGLVLQLGDDERRRLRGFFGLTQQPDHEIAHNYGLRLDVHVRTSSSLFLAYETFGSRFYAYQALLAGFSYRW